MEIALTVLAMLLLLGCEAFFSGSEIGVVSADRMKLRHEASKGSRGARLALRMLQKPEWLLATTLVGTNISVVANTTLATGLVIELLGERYSWLAIVIVAPLIWIFGEIVAKSVFQQKADAITPVVIFILKGASYVFMPILVVFSGLTRLLTRLLGDRGHQNPFTLREEISAMMEMSAPEGDILPMERRMIRRVFNFGETQAKDVMTPIADVVGIGRDASCGEALRLAAARSHKRLAVYEQDRERVVGMLNVLDVLEQNPGKPIKSYIRPVHYSPSGVSIETLLADIREGAGTMAIVVDEFGAARGMVMLEDILEVIVGDLEDEFDADSGAEASVRKMAERDFIVSGHAKIAWLRDEFGLPVPEGDYATLAGLVLGISKTIPHTGAVVRHQDLAFTVQRATAQTIEEIRVRW